MVWLAFIVAAYVIGSIPFGVLIARTRGGDIRAVGSRNIGATNVGRVLGRRLGLLCFALDVLKGAVPTVAAGLATGVLGRSAADLSVTEMWLWLAVAVAAVLGHVLPVFLRFRGGKGVATGFGAFASMWPLLTIPTLVALVAWYAVLRFTRFVSLASMLAALSVPISYLLTVRSAEEVAARVTHGYPPLVVTAAMALFVVYRHRSNIARLCRGEEPRTDWVRRRGTGAGG